MVEDTIVDEIVAHVIGYALRDSEIGVGAPGSGKLLGLGSQRLHVPL